MIPTPNLKTVGPILVSSQVEISPGQTLTPPLGDLYFGARLSVLVDEIHFRVYGNSQGFTWNDWRGFIRVGLKMGRHGITKEPTPIWNLGRLNANNVVYTGLETDATGYTFASWTWRLPAPLLVSGNSVIVPTIVYKDYATPAGEDPPPAVKVSIAYAGRVIASNQPLPARWPIPAVAFYESEDRPFSTSNAEDLMNPYRHDLHVQRFTTHLLASRYTEGIGPTDAGIDLLGNPTRAPDALSDAPVAANPGDFKIKMIDRLRTLVTKDFTPTGQFVDRNSRSWFVDTILPPNDYYIVQVEKPAADYPGVLHQIAMIGCRMEDL